MRRTGNPHLARAEKVKTKNGTRTIRELSSYPVIPSWWPSNAIRRAIKQCRESRLPAEWKAFLTANPKLREQIRAL